MVLVDVEERAVSPVAVSAFPAARDIAAADTVDRIVSVRSWDELYEGES